MTHLSSLSLAAILFASASTVAQTVPGNAEPITVRVYDFGGVDSAKRAEALQDAQATFAEAGIASAWHDCTHGVEPAPSACREPRRERDLIVRIVRRSTSDGLPRALGASVVESGRGVLATVFLDLIEPVAHRAGTSVDALLGRTMAHEVGHLLLGTSAHSATGLMRDVWTDHELGRNDARDWRFDATDILAR